MSMPDVAQSSSSENVANIPELLQNLESIKELLLTYRKPIQAGDVDIAILVIRSMFRG